MLRNKDEDKTISASFVGYAEKSKGYRFYCLSYTNFIVESRNIKFLENNMESGSDHFQNIAFENNHVIDITSHKRIVVQYGTHMDGIHVQQLIVIVSHN